MFLCKTELQDGRCADGCCGEIRLLVTSPKTGRTVECPFHYAPASVQARLNKAIPEREIKGSGHIIRHEGRAVVSYTGAELRALLKVDGESDPS